VAKITKMTAEQEAYLPIYRAEWIRNGEDTTQSAPEVLRRAILELYAATDLREPKVIVMDSPFGCLVARALMKNANLGDNLGANLRDNLWDNLRDNLGANLWDNLGANLWDNASLWGHHDVGWLAFYDFPLSLGHQYPDNLSRRLAATVSQARLCGWLYAYDGIAFVSQKQCELHRDEQGRLHSADRPAMAFADGYGFHAWHGIRVPSWCIDDRSKITKETILAEGNTEIRRAMCEIIGWPRALEMLGGKTIHADECLGLPRKLIELDLKGERVRLLHMTNGTIENGERRSFIEGVPTTINTCHNAVAWQCGLPAKIYNEGVRT
jgi:hypothetical protein